MTGLNAVAQWLLGGGGEALRFVLYVIVAWVLIGALPRMRRDAEQKVPQVRSAARRRMQGYATSGRRKPAEWWGWTAAWGAVSVAAEGARFGGYVVRSAWHGWGDHRRRVKALRVRAATVKPPWRKTDPEPDATPPPDGGGSGGGGTDAPPPGGGSPGTAPAELPRETTPDRPAEPPQADEPPQPAAPPRDDPELQPAGTGGPGNADVIPFAPRTSASSESKGETPVSAEIGNLEAAEQVVMNMQGKAQREFDTATAERDQAKQSITDADQASADLAAAGVKGPVMEAFTNYYEAMQRAELAAISKMVAAESALAAANAARGALMAHRDAAERLAATGGAADSTKWYGATG